MRRNLSSKNCWWSICGIEGRGASSLAAPVLFISRTGWTTVSISREKPLTPVRNRIHEEAISPMEQVKAMKNEEKTKRKNETRYDEIIIPNWTYSTGLGVVYNPIREKSLRFNRRNPQKKTQLSNPTAPSTIRLTDNTPVRVMSTHLSFSSLSK